MKQKKIGKGTKSKLWAFRRARRPDQIEQRREEILQAALVLFQKNGLENVSLNDIARKTGTAKSNIYRYFDSREHIYLRVLQRLATDFENRIYTALEPLKGKGTVAKVAVALTEVYMKSEQYGELITVVNPVLDRRLAPALVMDFRAVFLERRKRLARALVSVIPSTTYEKILPLTLHLFLHVPGLWPFGHPTRDSEKMLKESRFAHLQIDFRTELLRFLELLLKAATA